LQVTYLIALIIGAVSFYYFGLVINLLAILLCVLGAWAAWKRHALMLWIVRNLFHLDILASRLLVDLQLMLAFAIFAVLHIIFFITVVAAPFLFFVGPIIGVIIMTLLNLALDIAIVVFSFLLRGKNLNPNAVIGQP